jgi:hypothetical protein
MLILGGRGLAGDPSISLRLVPFDLTSRDDGILVEVRGHRGAVVMVLPGAGDGSVQDVRHATVRYRYAGVFATREADPRVPREGGEVSRVRWTRVA